MPLQIRAGGPVSAADSSSKNIFAAKTKKFQAEQEPDKWVGYGLPADLDAPFQTLTIVSS